jgi:hypothetical protein
VCVSLIIPVDFGQKICNDSKVKTVSESVVCHAFLHACVRFA